MRRFDKALLQALVDDGECEGITLEFKSAKLVEKAKSSAIGDLGCEISAFANSAGGTLIIGIEERQEGGSGGIAQRVAGIVQEAKWKAGWWRAEWLAAKLEERIEPKINGLDVSEVALADGSWCLVVTVPQSPRAPHQAEDRKYYARRQFQKLPMAHYEIEDIRNRQRVRRSDIRFELIIDRGEVVELSVENSGDRPVHDLRFVIPKEAQGAFKCKAAAFENGITALNPGERLLFFVGTLTEWSNHPILRNDTKIELLYREDSGTEEARFIVFNYNNYELLVQVQTDIERMSEDLVKQGKRIEGQLEKIGKGIVESLGSLCGATGLSISRDTLARLGAPQLANVQWNPRLLSWRGVQEVLECSDGEAIALERYFRRIGVGEKTLAEVGGVSDDLLARVRARFRLEDRDA